MGHGFEVDGLSLVLLAGMVTVLVVAKYQKETGHPALHPMILARQSETSPVHAPGESATYRNVNAPLGFDLAMRPQRSAPDVASLLSRGVTGTEGEHVRRVLDRALATTELRQQAAAFAQGLEALFDGTVPTLVVYGRLRSAHSLIAMLAYAVADKHGLTLVVPDGADVASLPSPALLEKTVVVCGEATAPLPGVLAHTAMAVVFDADNTPAALHHGRVMEMDEVLGLAPHAVPAPSDRSALRSAGLDEAGARTFALFYDPALHAWLRATHTAITSGVTTWLSEYPPEKIPGMADTILTDAYDAQVLSAPAYVTLLLTALYTGAAITSESTADTLASAKALQPTLFYLSAAGAQQIEHALWLPASGALLHAALQRTNMYALRSGRIPRDSLLDTLVCAPLRKQLGLQATRSVVVVGPGAEIDQGLLDQLRLYLAAAVMHAYVPAHLQQGRVHGVMTAPAATSNMYDLQAFAPQLVDSTSARRLPPHVGPPAVSMELKLVHTSAHVPRWAPVFACLAHNAQSTRGDPIGEVYVRGYAVAHTGAADTRADSTVSDWFATGDVATMRTNGTLVLVANAGAQAAGVLPDTTLSPEPMRVPAPAPPEPAASSDKPAAAASGAASTLTSGALPPVGPAVLPRKGFAVAPVLLAMLALCAVPVQAAHSSRAQLERRGSQPLNNATMVNLVFNSLMTAQRASWEQGVTQSAVLETYYPQWSVFQKRTKAGQLYPAQGSLGVQLPAQLLSLAYHSIAAQDATGRLATIVTGDEVAQNGASQDSASCGEGVLIGAWSVDGFTNGAPDPTGYWGRGATRQLAYLENNVARGPNGVLSQRAAPNQLQLWADSVYMGPPFLALYGLLTNNDTLIQFAYEQVASLQQALVFPNGPAQGLWGHILNDANATAPRWIDQRAWLTGHAWAAAGMLRVLATIQQSPSQDAFGEQRTNLVAWITDALDAAYNFVDAPTGLFYNVIDNKQSFLDGSGSALLAYAVFRLGSMVPANRAHIDMAELAYSTLQKSVDPYGSYTNGILTVNALSTSGPGATSTESLAFLALLAAARRDYYAGNTTGATSPVQPPPGMEAGARQARSVSVAALASALLATALLLYV